MFLSVPPPSVPHQKPLSSLSKKSHCKARLYRAFLVWKWGMCVELRGFWCGTEGFLGLKRSDPFVWNWCVELRGVLNWEVPISPDLWFKMFFLYSLTQNSDFWPNFWIFFSTFGIGRRLDFKIQGKFVCSKIIFGCQNLILDYPSNILISFFFFYLESNVNWFRGWNFELSNKCSPEKISFW